MPSSNRVLTGTKGLDDMLEGGVPRGNCFLLQGPPGNEKGIIARQYVKQGLEGGEGVLVVLSETSVEDFRRGMMALGLATQRYEKSGALHIIDWYTHKHSHIKGVELGKGGDTAVIRTNVDLSNLGIALNKAMDSIAKFGERRAVFDILSQALFTFGQNTTYNFAQTTVAKCREHDVTAMFVLEASAHEPSVLSVIQQSFDGQVEISKGGKGVGPATTEICVMSMSGTEVQQSYMALAPDGKGLKVRMIESEARPPAKPAKASPMGGKGIMALVSRAKEYSEKDEAEKAADYGELDGIVKGFLEEEDKEVGGAEDIMVEPEPIPGPEPEPMPEPEPQPVQRTVPMPARPPARTPKMPAPAQAPAPAPTPTPAPANWSRPEGTLAHCPMCDKPVGIRDIECPHCGMVLVDRMEVVKCSDCDGEVAVSDILCPHCGAMFEEGEGADGEAEGEFEKGTVEGEDIVGSEAVLIRLRPWGTKGFSFEWIRPLLEKDVEIANKEATVFISRAKEVERLEGVVKRHKDKAALAMLEDIRKCIGSPDNSKRLGVEWKIIELKNRLKMK